MRAWFGTMRGRRLGEEERRLAVRVRAHLARVRGVVAADAVDAVDGELLGAAFDRDGGSGWRGKR